MNVAIGDLRVEDAGKIARWKSDPDLSRQLLSDFRVTDEARAIEWLTENSADDGQCLLGIYLERGESSDLVGIVRLMYIDRESSTAELGIYVGDRTNRGRGIGGGALDLILRRAFHDMRLEKVYLRVASYNEGAIALYSKRNFRVEGTLRQHHRSNGSFHDVVCMAIFRGDVA